MGVRPPNPPPYGGRVPAGAPVVAELACGRPAPPNIEYPPPPRNEDPPKRPPVPDGTPPVPPVLVGGCIPSLDCPAPKRGLALSDT